MSSHQVFQTLQRACALVGAAFVLMGCSSFRTEIGNGPIPKTSMLIDGASRVETVVDEVGPPHAVSALPDGFVFLYEFSDVREFQWGISLEFLKLPAFKAVRGTSGLSQSVRLFLFDEEGVLISQGVAEWDEKLGSGGALQFVFSAISLTDTTSLKLAPDPLQWGRYNFQRLPEVLNAGQDLRTGVNGLQQRVAPVFAGQSTLEMSRPAPIKAKRKKSARQ